MMKEHPQDQTNHCPMCEDAAKKIVELERRIAEQESRHMDIHKEIVAENAELEQRVKVLTDYIDKAIYADSQNERQAILEEALELSPQQTAAQIERGHVEWMMKLPVFAYSYKSSKGHDIVNHEFCRELIAICPSDMIVTKLVAIPPFPKESKE